jgi:DNA-binding NarL/FixJ family response regulator
MAVDDHPLMREGIASALSGAGDIELVAEANNGAEAVEQHRKYRPDVTLMDIQMPGGDGIEAMTAIRKEFPEAKLIMLTIYRGDVQARRAIKAGASSYLLKSMLQKELQETIRLVHAGRRYIPAEVACELANGMLSAGLSDTEVSVLKLVASGYTNKLIARSLDAPEETIKSRMKSILTKLSAKDRAHAVTIAMRRGIIEMF